MKEKKKEVEELTEEQEKAIKELIKLIEVAHKKEILEKENLVTTKETRGKIVELKIKKEDGQYIAIVDEKYLIKSVKYAKLEEFINELNIRIHELDF